MRNYPITLTTDFGASDWFVGAVKGVILRLAPQARVVDISHDIPPGDLRAAAFALMASCRYFPKGAVHVVVVDPGVGSRRRAIAVRTASSFFVGPDNGVLSWALGRETVEAVRLLEDRRYFLAPVSRTFHGRDIFAPVAAHLSRGLPISRLGRELEDYARLPWPQPTNAGGALRGEVVHIDRFGNAITNLGEALVAGGGPRVCKIVGKRTARCPLAEFYGAVPAGRPVAVIGSSGFLEFALNGDSAARLFGLQIGDVVTVRGLQPGGPPVPGESGGGSRTRGHGRDHGV